MPEDGSKSVVEEERKVLRLGMERLLGGTRVFTFL